MRKITSVLFMLIATLCALAVHAQEAPDELVRRSTNDILAAIKADKDLQGGNQQKIEKLAEDKILPYFNFVRMTQLAVGRNWREANDGQKKTLIDEFRTLLVRTYSTSLSQYRNQTIDVKPMKIAARIPMWWSRHKSTSREASRFRSITAWRKPRTAGKSSTY